MRRKTHPFFIDLHQDIADNSFIISGKDFFKRNRLHQGKNEAGLPVNNQVDLPRLKKARARLVFASTTPFVIENKKIKIAQNPQKAVFSRINFYFRLLEKSRSLILVKRYKDYLKVKLTKKIGFLLHIEGADFVDKDMTNLELVYHLGVRSLGLTHNERNKLAGGASSKGGLTRLGGEAIKKAQKLGMIIDLAHLNKRSFTQAIKLVKPPFMVSHCGLKGVKRYFRNLDDSQIKQIKEKEGIIGLAFAPNFYPGNSLRHLVEAFWHLKKLVGTKNLAIGSDFDGIISKELFLGLEDVSKIKNLWQALLASGFKRKELEGIFFKNVETKLLSYLK